MVATRGRTFKRPWRRSCLSSKLKSSSAPIGRKDSWCFHAVGSSNAPLLGSTAAEGLPRIGRTSIATRWRSCGLPQSASCSENFVIPPDVFGQTLRDVLRANQRDGYALLMKAVAESIIEIARDPRYVGATVGVLAVLHTWTQQLLYHPHVHCLVTGGGVSADGSSWHPARR